MDILKLLRETRRLRAILASAALLIAGVVLLVLEGIVPTLLVHVVDGVAVALLTAGAVGMIYDFFLRKRAVEEVLSLVNLRSNIYNAGVEEVGFYQEIAWNTFFANPAGDIDILLTYGRTYAASQAAQILRAAEPGKRRVQVSLLDADGRRSTLEEYAESFDLQSADRPDTAELARRIREARQIWVDAANELKASGGYVNLRIEAVRVLLPFTYYRVGDQMWIIIMVARHGRVADGIPAIRVRKTGSPTGLFEWALTDIGKCREEKRIVLVEEVKS